MPEEILAAHNALAAIPGAWATPDPSTLATIPKGGVQLSYMGHAEITLALIAIDPLWTWEPLAVVDGRPVIALEGKRLVMWARLVLCGKSILGVGTCDAGKSDPEKELIGDFLRNAAMRFGIATKLWSKAVDADAAGSGPAGGYDRTPQAEIDQTEEQALAIRFTQLAPGDRATVIGQAKEAGCRNVMRAGEHVATVNALIDNLEGVAA